MALIPTHYPDCVVALGVDDGKGQPAWGASGFLYGTYDSGEGENKAYKVWLVTNRHVFEGLGQTVYLRFNPAAGEDALTSCEELVDKGGTPRWFAHPNKEVDVAVMFVNSQALESNPIKFSIFRNDADVARTQEMVELGITEGDFAYVLGFPMGYGTEGRTNTVIVRSGSIARIRDTLANPEQEFLLDAFIFPGNSGGPVILKPELTRIEGTKSHPNALLIGIIKGWVPYEDRAISEHSGQVRVLFQENSGLALAFSVDCIEETIQEATKILTERERQGKL